MCSIAKSVSEKLLKGCISSKLRAKVADKKLDSDKVELLTSVIVCLAKSNHPKTLTSISCSTHIPEEKLGRLIKNEKSQIFKMEQKKKKLYAQINSDFLVDLSTTLLKLR